MTIYNKVLFVFLIASYLQELLGNLLGGHNPQMHVIYAANSTFSGTPFNEILSYDIGGGADNKEEWRKRT